MKNVKNIPIKKKYFVRNHASYPIMIYNPTVKIVFKDSIKIKTLKNVLVIS